MTKAETRRIEARQERVRQLLSDVETGLTNHRKGINNFSAGVKLHGQMADAVLSGSGNVEMF